jgi:hypothetical protein
MRISKVHEAMRAEGTLPQYKYGSEPHRDSRRGSNKGVVREYRDVKRLEAHYRNEETPPERKSTKRHSKFKISRADAAHLLLQTIFGDTKEDKGGGRRKGRRAVRSSSLQA